MSEKVSVKLNSIKIVRRWVYLIQKSGRFKELASVIPKFSAIVCEAMWKTEVPG
jgi:hypothetical protein